MSLEKVSKEQMTRLVEARMAIGLERQSELQADFSKLMELLTEHDLRPFDSRAVELVDKLNGCCENFKTGGHWKIGDQSANRYFYRCENLESFLRKHRKFLYTDYNMKGKILVASDPPNPEKMFETIIRNYMRDSGWQPMTRLVKEFFSYRGFSWWTNEFVFDEAWFPEFFEGHDLTIENQWLLKFAFKVGIASDWLSANMLFLRLDSHLLQQDDIRIPSIIDAFLQPIFSPRAYQQERRWGLAFDLDTDIRPLFREYVIRNIPAEAITYFPVRINLDSINSVNPKARLTDSLVSHLIDNI